MTQFYFRFLNFVNAVFEVKGNRGIWICLLYSFDFFFLKFVLSIYFYKFLLINHCTFYCLPCLVLQVLFWDVLHVYSGLQYFIISLCLDHESHTLPCVSSQFITCCHVLLQFLSSVTELSYVLQLMWRILHCIQGVEFRQPERNPCYQTTKKDWMQNITVYLAYYFWHIGTH